MECSVDSCTRRAGPRGWCGKHYQRWYAHGDPTYTERIRGDDEARLLSKLDQDGPVPAHAPHLGPCWLWTGKLDRAGYGAKMTLPAGDKRPHQLAYVLWVGPVPEGLELDHLCFVRHCANPAHLEPVTHAENTRRRKRHHDVHAPTTSDQAATELLHQ